MGINFPASPLVGDKYPTPAQPGVPQYTWDGTMWTASSSAAGYVRLSGDVMTGPLTLSGNAVSALHAVPKQQLDARVNDAMAYSGMQINGSMEISQENGANPVTVQTGNNARFVVDGYVLQGVGPQIVQGRQSPNGVGGLPYSLMVNVTTAAPAPVGNDFCRIYVPIEGTRMSRLAWGATNNSQPMTVGFWVYSQVRAGTLGGSISSHDGGRGYTFSVTINAAAAWEYKTVTIPPPPVGLWRTNNEAAAYISFTFSAAGTNVGAANVWYSGPGSGYMAPPGCTNFIQSTSDVVAITGVVVLPGIYAPTAEQSPLIMRPYDQELLMCQRYWFKTNSHWQGRAGQAVKWVHSYHVPMRTTATNIAAVLSQGVAGFAGLTTTEATPDYCTIQFNATAGSDGYVNVTLTSDARL